MTVQIDLPDNMDISQKEILMALAAQLYGSGKLSLGQAADVAGYSKITFMELLSDQGISIFNYQATDLLNDLKNAGHYHS